MHGKARWAARLSGIVGFSISAINVYIVWKQGLYCNSMYKLVLVSLLASAILTQQIILCSSLQKQPQCSQVPDAVCGVSQNNSTMPFLNPCWACNSALVSGFYKGNCSVSTSSNSTTVSPSGISSASTTTSISETTASPSSSSSGSSGQPSYLTCPPASCVNAPVCGYSPSQSKSGITFPSNCQACNQNVAFYLAGACPNSTQTSSSTQSSTSSSGSGTSSQSASTTSGSTSTTGSSTQPATGTAVSQTRVVATTNDSVYTCTESDRSANCVSNGLTVCALLVNGALQNYASSCDACKNPQTQTFTKKSCANTSGVITSTTTTVLNPGSQSVSQPSSSFTSATASSTNTSSTPVSTSTSSSTSSTASTTTSSSSSDNTSQGTSTRGNYTPCFASTNCVSDGVVVCAQDPSGFSRTYPDSCQACKSGNIAYFIGACPASSTTAVGAATITDGTSANRLAGGFTSTSNFLGSTSSGFTSNQTITPTSVSTTSTSMNSSSLSPISSSASSISSTMPCSSSFRSTCTPDSRPVCARSGSNTFRNYPDACTACRDPSTIDYTYTICPVVSGASSSAAVASNGTNVYYSNTTSAGTLTMPAFVPMPAPPRVNTVQSSTFTATTNQYVYECAPIRVYCNPDGVPVCGLDTTTQTALTYENACRACKNPNVKTYTKTSCANTAGSLSGIKVAGSTSLQLYNCTAVLSQNCTNDGQIVCALTNTGQKVDYPSACSACRNNPTIISYTRASCSNTPSSVFTSSTTVTNSGGYTPTYANTPSTSFVTTSGATTIPCTSNMRNSATCVATASNGACGYSSSSSYISYLNECIACSSTLVASYTMGNCPMGVSAMASLPSSTAFATSSSSTTVVGSNVGYVASNGCTYPLRGFGTCFVRADPVCATLGDGSEKTFLNPCFACNSGFTIMRLRGGTCNGSTMDVKMVITGFTSAGR